MKSWRDYIFYEDERVTLLVGDVREIAPLLPASIAQTTITSPPYFGLRDYNVDGQIGLEPTPSEFVEAMIAVFDDTKRVLKDDGTAWVNLGDSYNGQGQRSPNITDDGELSFRSGGLAINHSGFKPKDLMLIPFDVAAALRNAGWWLRNWFPWVKRCLSGGTWLYVRSQKGDMPMMLKDLVRLRPETIQLWNGHRWTQVKGFHSTTMALNGMRDYLEIELRTGERIGCTSDHRWPLADGRLVFAHELKVGDVLSRARLPEPDAVQTPTHLPDEDIGWFLGLYLAEGCRSERIIHLAGHVNETEKRWERLKPIADAYGSAIRAGRITGNRQDINLSGQVLHGILRQYIYGDSSLTKCLTPKCWQRSDAFLRALLQGYLEGDGHWDAKNERWRLGVGNNDKLARDLRTLCARLGIDIRLKRGRATAEKGGKIFKVWRGSIRFTGSEVDSVKHAWTRFKPANSLEIVSIGRSNARTFWDIEVADEPHLFSLASGVLTHNSAMPDSARDRAGNSLEVIFHLAKKKDYFYDLEAVRTNAAPSSIERWNQNLASQNGSTRSNGNTRTDRPMKATGNRDRSNGNRNGEGGHLDTTDAGSRNFRNADLWFESVDKPHGLTGMGDDLIGIDVNSAGFSAEFCTACERYYHDAKDKKEIETVTSDEGIVTRVCICGRSDAWLSHFATFPQRLIEPFIKCGTSEAGECSECGLAWVREVEVELKPTGKASYNSVADSRDFNADLGDQGSNRMKDGHKPGWFTHATTIGFSPQCDCQAPAVPQTVFEPFSGAGTTFITAAKLGRKCIAVELNEDYAKMSIERYKREMRMPVDPPRREEAMPLFAMAETTTEATV